MVLPAKKIWHLANPTNPNVFQSPYRHSRTQTYLNFTTAVTTHNIIQWNCRRLWCNYEDSLHTFNKPFPCGRLSSGNFATPNWTLSFPEYTGVLNYSTSILLRTNISHSKITISSPLQATAIRASLNTDITICYIYIPSNTHLQRQNFWFTWNTTATHSPWRYLLSSTIITTNDLIDSPPTFIHSGIGSYSRLHLSLAFPCILLNYHWQVTKDLSGSDHFPILPSANPPPPPHIANRKLKQADSRKFRILCTSHLSDIVPGIAYATIPKASEKDSTQQKRFNNTCKDAIRERKTGPRSFRRAPTPEKIEKITSQSSNCNLTLRSERKDSLNIYSKSKAVWSTHLKVHTCEHR